MKNLLFSLAIIVASTQALSAEQWQTYKNDKYKYEVSYPVSYEVTLIGLEEDRDGKSIRIAKKYTSRMHGIHIDIHPGMSFERTISTIDAPDLKKLDQGSVNTTTKLHNVTWQKTVINGVPAVKMQVNFKESGELFMTSLAMDQVVFRVHVWPDAGLDEETAEQIIATFKWETD